MEKKTILVTGIGGNVGQGIIRLLRHCLKDIKIIGTNTLPFSAGNHLVDLSFIVPYGYSDNYIERIHEIVEKQQVDLIIPSTDFEVANLARNKHKLKCLVATSGTLSTEVYLDKFYSSEFHKKFDIPFAKSFLPSQYKNNDVVYIAKPRKGRGSRGIIYNYNSKEELNDNEYLIQEFQSGIEITTAVYVSYNNRKIIGTLTMERTLENGTTTYCKVITSYDDQLKKIIEKIVANSDILGSFNIQSIVNENNDVIPFEVNCRISGTNSIRHFFGFQDVLYTVNELLFNKKVNSPKILPGIAYRYLSDVIYPQGIEENNLNDNFIVF